MDEKVQAHAQAIQKTIDAAKKNSMKGQSEIDSKFEEIKEKHKKRTQEREEFRKKALQEAKADI